MSLSVMFSNTLFQQNSTYPWVYFLAPHLMQRQILCGLFFLIVKIPQGRALEQTLFCAVLECTLCGIVAKTSVIFFFLSLAFDCVIIYENSENICKVILQDYLHLWQKFHIACESIRKSHVNFILPCHFLLQCI